MTNILAILTVAIVTNITTEVDREVLGYSPTGCPDGMVGCLVYHCEPTYGKVKGKTVTTKVVEVSTLSFRWKDLPRELTSERAISSSSVYYKKTEGWEEADEVKPEWHGFPPILSGTNNILYLTNNIDPILLDGSIGYEQ